MLDTWFTRTGEINDNVLPLNSLLDTWLHGGELELRYKGTLNSLLDTCRGRLAVSCAWEEGSQFLAGYLQKGLPAQNNPEYAGSQFLAGYLTPLRPQCSRPPATLNSLLDTCRGPSSQYQQSCNLSIPCWILDGYLLYFTFRFTYHFMVYLLSIPCWILASSGCPS